MTTFITLGTCLALIKGKQQVKKEFNIGLMLVGIWKKIQIPLQNIYFYICFHVPWSNVTNVKKAGLTIT